MASDPQRKQLRAADALYSKPNPFELRPLLHDVPLSADGKNEDIKINCVDYLGMRFISGEVSS
jgi:hypothetical protein